MTQDEYEKICKESGAIELGHPEFDASYHKDYLSNVTVVIPQRKTFEFTRLCLESLLRFYPDIKIITIDGNSEDESTLYLKYKSLIHPNVTYYNHIGLNSHGEILDLAFTHLVKTEFAVTMDSDTITSRGGWIEGMLKQFQDNSNLYATGTLMLVTYKGEACGAPQDEEDILRYAHPSCSMYYLPTYHKIGQPATDHGAALALNMMKAKELGYEIGAYPIDKFVSHRMGVSWVKEHQIIWYDDYNVFVRPFITFILNNGLHIGALYNQTDRDFNLQVIAPQEARRIYDTETKDIKNSFYGIRFLVNGEYVVVINLNTLDMPLPNDFVHHVKLVVIEQNAPDELMVDGIRIVKRNIWQSRDCLI